MPASRPATQKPVALFVLGFGRSGTSALTRVLALSGAALPAGMLGATGANPRGYWEPRAAIHLNQAILHRHGSSGYDVTLRMHEKDSLDAKENAADIAKIQAYLTTLPPAPLIVIKEVKLTPVADLWFEAARQAGFDIASVIAVRHPQEVIGSLAQRTRRQPYLRASPELTCAGWLKNTLLAERNSRGVPRVFVDYANLLEDWRREVKRISAALEVDLSIPDESAIDGFLTPTLRHHRYGGSVPEPFGTDWMSVVYEELSAAARDEPWNESALDHVFEAYRASERGFRTALKDSQRYLNLDRFLLAPLVKLALEGLALAHRRRGTWA